MLPTSVGFPLQSLFNMHPSNFRLRLLLDLLKILVLPSVVFHLISTRLLEKPLGALSYIAFVICWSIGKTFLRGVLHRAERKRLGAREIPCIQGAWPGNIDVLLKMLRAFKTSYIGDVYLQLFEEYQCTTLNTRILWTDHVRCGFVLFEGMPAVSVSLSVAIAYVAVSSLCYVDHFHGSRT